MIEKNDYTIGDATHLFTMDDITYLSENPYNNNFQNDLTDFMVLIQNLVNKEENKTFIHFGDGDYLFLKKIRKGSAKPGRRALSVPYKKIEMEKFKSNFQKNDFFCTIKILFNYNCSVTDIFPSIINTIPTEFIYGLVSNKWFFKTFSQCIGLIGANEKLELIKDLLQKKEYKEYLGLDSFQDYISIPQKFACDNVSKLDEDISIQLKNAKSKIFLVGIGHVKSFLMSQFKLYHKAIYIDVGSGIDAIAGIIDQKRPYFKNWINYSLVNHNYSNIDMLQYSRNEDINKVVSL